MTQRDVEAEAEGDGRRSDPGQEGRQDGGDAAPADGNAERERSDVAELEDRWRRALADLDNLRKRYSRELPRERAAERERVAAAFLPVIDNIDLALRHTDAEPGAIVEGMRAIREQALAVLAQLASHVRTRSGGRSIRLATRWWPSSRRRRAPSPGWSWRWCAPATGARSGRCGPPR